MDDNNINNIKFAFSPSDNALVQWSEPIVYIIYYYYYYFIGSSTTNYTYEI